MTTKQIRESIIQIGTIAFIIAMYWFVDVADEGKPLQYASNIVTFIDIVGFIAAFVGMVLMRNLEDFLDDCKPTEMVSKFAMERTGWTYAILIVNSVILGKLFMAFVWIVFAYCLLSYAHESNKRYKEDHPDVQPEQESKSALKEMASE